MSLASRLVDLAKDLDGLLAAPLSALSAPPGRPLPEAPRDVLVTRLWGLGNLVLLRPHLLGALRSGARVRLLTLARNREFVVRQVAGVELLTVPEPHHPDFLPAAWRVARALRAAPPGLVLDAEQFLRLPLLLARTACAAPCVGLDTPGQGRARLLDRAVPHDPTRHVAQTYAALCHAAGLPAPCTDPPGANAREHARVAARLPDDRRPDAPLVVLHPGTGDHFPGRRWPPDRFAALARRLAREDGARLVLTGSASERALCAAIARRAGAGVTDLAGTLDLGELVALLEGADLLVANDTGPVHLADALGRPVVALYGPNTPHRYGPRGPAARALFADLPCSPCLDDRTRKRSGCRHHACMRALDVELVHSAARAALAAGPLADGKAAAARLDAPPLRVPTCGTPPGPGPRRPVAAHATGDGQER